MDNSHWLFPGMLHVILYLPITVPFRSHTAGLPFIIFKCFIKRGQCVIWHVDSSLWWCRVHRCLALACAVARVRGKGRGSRIEAEAGSLIWCFFKGAMQGFTNGFMQLHYLLWMRLNVSDSKTIACLCCEGCPDIIEMISKFHIQSIHLESDRNIYARAHSEPFSMNALVVLCTWSVFCRTGLTAGFHPSVSYVSCLLLCLSLSFYSTIRCPNPIWLDELVISPLFLLSAHTLCTQIHLHLI